MSSSDHSNRQAEGASSPEPLSTIRMRVVQDPVGTAHYISGLHAEVERLHSLLRQGADLMQHGPAWDDDRATWVQTVEGQGTEQ